MLIAMGLRIWIDEGCILCSWCQNLAPEIFIFDGHGTEIRAEVRVDHRRSANRRERSPLTPAAMAAINEPFIQFIADGCPPQVIRLLPISDVGPLRLPARTQRRVSRKTVLNR